MRRAIATEELPASWREYFRKRSPSKQDRRLKITKHQQEAQNQSFIRSVPFVPFCG